MPRISSCLIALGAAAAACLAGMTPAASARSSLLDEAPADIRLALDSGLRPSDSLYQPPTAPLVLPPSRVVAIVPASSIIGLTPARIATVLRQALDGAGARIAVVDEVGASFAGAPGDALASAMASLSRQTAKWTTGPLSRRVHFYVEPNAGTLLAASSMNGARSALGRGGAVWLKDSGWSALEWLTWPAETVRQLASRGLSASRVHVSMTPGGQDAAWAAATTGSACAVLASGPGTYRLGPEVAAFAAHYRSAFPQPASRKDPPSSCTAAPVLPRDGASALVASAARETTGLPIPPGGLVTPPLVAGEPAQVTLQLGADPLGLAAGLGVTPEAAWEALAVVVQVRGAGVALDAPIAGDGSAALAFTPTEPGPVSMRIVVQGSGVSTALGAPSDLVQPLASTAFSAPLLARVVTDPDGWTLTIPLVPTGGSVGDPVLVIVPPFG